MSDVNSSAFRDLVAVVIMVVEFFVKVGGFQPNSPQIMEYVEPPAVVAPCPDRAEEMCEYIVDPCACEDR